MSLIPCHLKRTLLWSLNVATNYKTYLGLHVKWLTLLPTCNQTGFSQHIFVRILNFKFHRNPSSESCADLGWQTDMTKPTGTFCNYTNATKNQRIVAHRNNSSIVNKRLKSEKYYKRNCLLVLCKWQQKTKYVYTMRSHSPRGIYACRHSKKYTHSPTYVRVALCRTLLSSWTLCKLVTP